MIDAIKILEKLQREQLDTVELVPWSELTLRPKQSYLIKGLLDAGTMSVIYGPSNSGKTFCAISMALSVALGEEWCGRKVRQGAVVYIAGEGIHGIAQRLEAYKRFHAVEPLPPFFVVPHSLDLLAEKPHTPTLIDKIKAIGNVSLVIVDTLARNFAGGNENASEDMGAFIINCDKIRTETGAHVMVIHHSGKNTENGARGHSSLRAATDTEIEVGQDRGVISATVRKQRDGETGERIQFRLRPVEIGEDEDGKKISSCVLSWDEQRSRINDEPSKKTCLALKVLTECLDTIGAFRLVESGTVKVLSITEDQFRAACIKARLTDSDTPDTQRKAFVRALKDLEKQGLSKTWEKIVWLPDTADKPGQVFSPQIPDRTDTDNTLEGCPLSGSDPLSVHNNPPMMKIPHTPNKTKE